MAVSDKLQNAMTFLRNVPAAAGKIFSDHLKTMNGLKQQFAAPRGASQGQINTLDASYIEAVKKTKTDSKLKLEAIEKQINENEATVRAEADAVIGFQDVPSGTNEQLLKLNKMTSAWQRLKPIFDRIPDAAFFSDGQRLVKEYVGEFSGRGDGASLAALYLELPFYISGRFSGDEAESDKLSFMRAFEDAIASADPSVQEVLQLKRELDNRGIYNARLAVTYCKQAIDQEDLAYMTTLWGEGMKTAIVDENGLQLQAAGGF